MHPYDLYLAFNGIEHRMTRAWTPQMNDLVDRFNRAVKEEFFEVVFMQKFFKSVEILQLDQDSWLTHYNTERPHRGERNIGLPTG